MKFALAAGLLLVAVGAAACGDSPTAPTSTVAPSPVTETFSSQLTVKGTASRSIVTAVCGTVSVMLAAMTLPGSILGLGIGIPRADGSGCSLSSSVSTGAASAAQLVVVADAGSYCVQVFDLGTLTDPVGFTVSIVRP